MRTRMVPFDALVPRLRRVIRQAAGETGKQAQLKLEGAQGELDRNVLERMTAPLEHMFRNAIAHGLKPWMRAARRARASEAASASRCAAKVRKWCCGRRRRRRPQPRGDPRARSSAGLTAGCGAGRFRPRRVDPRAGLLHRRIGEPPGRSGVGMDVVASEVRQLGGSLDIASAPAKAPPSPCACRRRWRSPRRCSSRSATSSTRCRSPRCRRRPHQPRGHGRRTRPHRYGGEDYALHDLGNLVGASATAGRRPAADAVAAGALWRAARAAVAIDQVLGKPRNRGEVRWFRNWPSVPASSGATIMGDGSVVVILDIAPLVPRGDAAGRRGRAAGRRAAPRAAGDGGRRLDHHAQVTGRVLERQTTKWRPRRTASTRWSAGRS